MTETALSTALNVSYMAEQLSLFSLVVGIALLLAGIGFIVLAYAALQSAASRTGHLAQHRMSAPSLPPAPRLGKRGGSSLRAGVGLGESTRPGRGFATT